jgi:hypothetical protein
MNSALFAKPNSVVPAQPATDFTNKEGYVVGLTTGKATSSPAIPVATLSASATVPIDGIILNGQPNDGRLSDVGVFGCLSPVRAKLSGAVANGDIVAQAADGTFVTDPGAGNARVVVGTALEDGVAGDLIIIAPFAPQIRA